MIARNASKQVIEAAFPIGAWVVSSTETGKVLGRVVKHKLNSKGVWLILVGNDQWSSYADETRLCDRAADALRIYKEHGRDGAYYYDRFLTDGYRLPHYLPDQAVILHGENGVVRKALAYDRLNDTWVIEVYTARGTVVVNDNSQYLR